MAAGTDGNDHDVSSLLAQRRYDEVIPILAKDVEKYPTNVRIRLQLADALAGAGRSGDAIREYEKTAAEYDSEGLIVQAIAVRKKIEKLRKETGAPPPGPQFDGDLPKSPLFESLSEEERSALSEQLVLQEFDEGDIVISEGEKGSSLFIVAQGEVKVFTRARGGDTVYLARLTEGDFFGEVSVLTGKPRTATVTASTRAALLRLDKKNLETVIEKHPRILEVLDRSYRDRADRTVEAIIESMKQRS